MIGFNEKLEDSPELINTDPYAEGWIVRVLVSDITDLDDLLDAETYQNLIN